MTKIRKDSRILMANMKRAGAYAVALAVSVVCVWRIMSPTDSSKEDSPQSGLNTSIPDPRGEGIFKDMESAYRQDALLAEQVEKMRAAEDTALLIGNNEPAIPVCRDSVDIILPDTEDFSMGTANVRSDLHIRHRTLRSSDEACLKLNRTLDGFYDHPQCENASNPPKTRTSAVVPNVQPASGSTYDEQVALLEKSYELAAKYMGDKSGCGVQDAECKPMKEYASRIGISRVEERVVSSLMPDDSLCRSEHRQIGFHTAVGKGDYIEKNTVGACVHTDQTITDGQDLKMRLTEDMTVGGVIIPRNTPVMGMCSIQGERLFVSVVSLEIDGRIIPVDIDVYDNNGQRGIHIPDSNELSAARDAVADAGQNAGTAVSISNRSAGGELLSELGKSAIQATSRYISGRMRIVKVHIKEGYDIMLYQDKKQNYE